MSNKADEDHSNQPQQPEQKTTPSKREQIQVSKEDHLKEREKLSEKERAHVPRIVEVRDNERR